MPSTEPNEKNTLIVIKTIFIIILIYQIFWLGSEVQKLKQSVKTIDEINTINTKTIQEIQSYLIQEAKENQRYKFIKI
jgi:hypothetical protein|tara:strand:+ start:1185 stop:1418 length:234 start_codon:yes stop_codon:yes gene_type:complete